MYGGGTVNDRQAIEQLYHDMYSAMVKKDEAELDRVHDESFVLIHMTGMRQDKATYIRAIMDGTLNYYSEKTDSLDVQVNPDDTAVLTGRSIVTAAVFGGGRHTWRLQLRFDLKKTGDEWKLLKAQASTY
jgi:uncharacterized protein (TIGR02246 family)